jgi:CDP-diglyceride synthetase
MMAGCLSGACVSKRAVAVSPGESISAAKLFAAIVVLLALAGPTVFYVWGTLDQTLAGHPRLVPSLVSILLILLFLSLAAFLGRIIKRHAEHS